MTWRKAETYCRTQSPRNNVREKNPWTKWQIQQARRTPLQPLLRKRGYSLRAMPKDNHLVEELKDLVFKDSYWIWPSHGMQGNAIDFFMLVETLSFNEAMTILIPEGPDIEEDG